jgi:hypothetical protein
LADGQPSEEEIFRQLEPRGGPEALRPFMGKWVGMDDSGQALVAGDTARAAGEEARLAGPFELTLFWVPNAAVIG